MKIKWNYEVIIRSKAIMENTFQFSKQNIFWKGNLQINREENKKEKCMCDIDEKQTNTITLKMF
jgi:hypothetical protein